MDELDEFSDSLILEAYSISELKEITDKNGMLDGKSVYVLGLAGEEVEIICSMFGFNHFEELMTWQRAAEYVGKPRITCIKDYMDALIAFSDVAIVFVLPESKLFTHPKGMFTKKEAAILIENLDKIYERTYFVRVKEKDIA